MNSDSANLECFIPEWVGLAFPRHTKGHRQDGGRELPRDPTSDPELRLLEAGGSGDFFTGTHGEKDLLPEDPQAEPARQNQSKSLTQ